jgi:ketosteroid isomerase-like protein
MSQENVEMVRLGYEAANRGDIDGLLDLCAPDVEWQDVVPDALSFQGKDGVRSYFQTVWEPWQEIRREPEEIIDLGGDQVLVLFRLTGRGKGSGIEIDLRGGDLLTVRGGRLARWMAYTDRAQALEAAGLSE